MMKDVNVIVNVNDDDQEDCSIHEKSELLLGFGLQDSTTTTAVAHTCSSGNTPTTRSIDESSMHVLWIDSPANHHHHYNNQDNDNGHPYYYSSSIRQTARRFEERWIRYFQYLVLVSFCIMVWQELWPIPPPEPTSISTSTSTSIKNDQTMKHFLPRRHRFNRHWKKKVEARQDSENTTKLRRRHGHGARCSSSNSRSSHRTDEDTRKILVVLKNLDEAIQGDVILRSNKTKFVTASMVWQQQQYTTQTPKYYCNTQQKKKRMNHTTAPFSSSLLLLPPLAVVEATTVEDVHFAVPILGGLARDVASTASSSSSLVDFRIRSGGYAYINPGSSTVSDGIMLSLAKLNTMSSTSSSSSGSGTAAGFQVTMGPGVRMEDFMNQVVAKEGYSGIVPSSYGASGVGMIGFTLGGGYGWQSRMYGLAIDNVRSVDVVLASGEIRTKVSPHSTNTTTNITNADNTDLFWSLCGSGGGTIAVVTSIDYEVYPSHDIKLQASVQVSLEEMTQFLQRIGEREPDLAPEFTLSIQGYTKTKIKTTTNHSNSSPTKTAVNGSNDDADADGNVYVTIHMYWMGDSNPDTNTVGMQYIKEEIVPLFFNHTPSTTTTTTTTTINNSDIVYYYFSWSGMAREQEQKPEYNAVWSAQSWNGFLLPQNNTNEVWVDILSSLAVVLEYCTYVSPKIELWGGAISTIPANATVFPYRTAIYNIGLELLVPVTSTSSSSSSSSSSTEDNNDNDIDIDTIANDEMHLVNAIWPSIARHLNGVFVNYPMASLSSVQPPSDNNNHNADDEESSSYNLYAKKYWGENLQRLIEMKDRYDPNHVLQITQGIPRKRTTTKTGTR